MPKSHNQKLKILYILDYLQKNSHEKHPVRASELIDMLENKHNISCDRKTIYSDIFALTEEYGADIISVPGKNGGYFMASRNFEPYELRLLINAVQSSRYLTESKSRELIKKLCDQCNEQDAKLMRRSMVVSGRVKSMNETIYYNVDAIQEAISENKQISFRYFDWGMDLKRHYRDKDYLASPYGLCQDNENCYLLAYSERHGITSYRVDRMAEIHVINEKRIPCPDLTGNELTKHASKLFQMYSGDSVNVKFRFQKKLINVVIDRFGRDLMLIPDGEDHFTFVTNIVVSPMFFSWMFGFGSDAQILYPQSVIDQMKQHCLDTLSQY